MLHNKKFRSIIIPAVLFIITAMFAGATKLIKDPTAHHIVKWVVEKNSTLRVEGKSNINSFTCNINEYAAKDTIVCIDELSTPIRLSGNLQMDVLSFNCHSSMITKDLRKTLKAEEYPKLNIRFLSLQSMPSPLSKTESIDGSLEVELAGVVKRFEVSYSFTTIGAGYIKLNGGHRFCFSDFKLIPPKKMAGLIKIKDEFDVNFQLILRTI
ncbi:MAG: hypothetical protein ABIN67_14830 [Ferruginibacter sp.]